ncbi:ATP-dependent nuclease [Rosistilla oblonga]|uniref:ATP-dependent nuclease n=1 Tax=Rosistilla oblonga TaxID=2527990 RepID=UPI003A97C705
MKLKQMTVKNFRGISGDKTTISFEKSEIIFLIGQNNTGKSSLLVAYKYLTTAKQVAVITDFYDNDTSTPIEIEAVFTKEPGDESKFKKKGLEKWVDDKHEIRLRRIWNSVGPGQKETWSPEEGKFVPDGFGGFDTIFQSMAPKAIYIPAMPKEEDLTKCINEVIKSKVLKSLSNEEEELCNEIAEQIRSLQSKVFSHDSVTSINDTVNEAFTKVFPTLALQILCDDNQSIDVSKFIEKDFRVHVTDNGRGGDWTQRITSYGHGVIRQAIFNFLGLIDQDAAKGLGEKSDTKEFLLLFEEPEIYLHPTSIFRTRKMLYELCEGTPFQILCASHSPSLIDLSRPHNSLIRVQKESEGKVYLHQIGDDVFAKDEQRKDRVQMINRFNPHICESFFVDNVILVEGDTEAIVVRHIVAQKWPNEEVYVLNTGSKNNMPFFQEVFNRFRINYHVIHDCDTKYIYDSNANVKQTREGRDRVNPAWALNQQIMKQVSEGRRAHSVGAYRYVHVENFECAHDYEYDNAKGKPLSAFEFAQDLDGTGDTRIEVILRQIFGELERENFDTEEMLWEANGKR